MAVITYIGNAISKAQVTEYVFAGTWEATDIVDITINGKTVSVTTGSTTIATFLATLVTALNASTVPAEHQEITWSASSPNLIATADTAGKPFDCTVSTRDVGGAADAQTIDGSTTSTGTNSTANSGPADAAIAANYSGGSLPTAGDTLILSGDVDILYNLDALSGVGTLAELRADWTFTGDLGLPRVNAGVSGGSGGSYYEYRPTELAVDCTLVNIYSTGGRFYLNTQTVQTAVNVYDSGTPSDAGTQTIQWRGTHASNVVNVVKGSFAAAQYVGQTTACATFKQGFKTSQQSDSDVFIGASCGTITAYTKTGGELENHAVITTLNQYGGDTSLIAAGIPTTLNQYGGKVIDVATGTTTTVTQYGGEYDARQGLAARTATNWTIYAGTLRDSFERFTFTNPIALKAPLAAGGVQGGIVLELGTDYALQRS